MSHVTDVRLKIRDLDALREACEHLGLELREGQTTYAWWGTFVGDSRDYGQHDPKKFGHSEHAIRIKGDNPKMGSSGPWEIGVVKAADGDGYDLLYDAYGSAGQRLTNAVGPNVNHLRKEYATANAMAQARKRLGPKGWTTERIDLPTGKVKLKVRKR
jgi:hypothetical protein